MIATALTIAREKGKSVEKAMEPFVEMMQRTFTTLFFGCEMNNKVVEEAMETVVARHRYMTTLIGLVMERKESKVEAMERFAEMQKRDMEQWNCLQRCRIEA